MNIGKFLFRFGLFKTIYCNFLQDKLKYYASTNNIEIDDEFLEWLDELLCDRSVLVEGISTNFSIKDDLSSNITFDSVWEVLKFAYAAFIRDLIKGAVDDANSTIGAIILRILDTLFEYGEDQSAILEQLIAKNTVSE